MPAPQSRLPALAPAPLSRRARHSAETRIRILRAALGLFAQQGFFATTVEQITEAADVGKGTFFNYFPTKEHVLLGFGDLQLSRIRAAVEAAREERGPVGEVFHRLIYALAEEPGRSAALVRSMIVANFSSEAVRQLTHRKIARGRRLLARLIAQGQQRGEIRRDLSPAVLVRFFQQAMFGAYVLWALHPTSKLSEWCEATHQLFWSGAAARSA